MVPFADPLLFAFMACVVFMAAIAQGVGGIGFAMVAAPIAAFFFPIMAPGPLLALGGFAALLTSLRERGAIDLSIVGYALMGRAVGTLVAIYAMATLAPRLLTVLFAVSVLTAVGLSAAGLRVRAGAGAVSGAGLASGIMGTITSVGAPPIALVLQNVAPAKLRATLGLILFLGSIFSLSMLALAGRFGRVEALLSLSLLPFMLLGFTASGPLRHRLRPERVRTLLLCACALSATGVLAKAVIQ